MKMKSPMLEAIKTAVVMALTTRYGYAGVAEMDNKCIINSGGEGENFVITIEDKSKEDET